MICLFVCVSPISLLSSLDCFNRSSSSINSGLFAADADDVNGAGLSSSSSISSPIWFTADQSLKRFNLLALSRRLIPLLPPDSSSPQTTFLPRSPTTKTTTTATEKNPTHSKAASFASKLADSHHVIWMKSLPFSHFAQAKQNKTSRAPLSLLASVCAHAQAA